MRDFIKKILKEEFDSDSDFDWITGTPDFEPGKYFEEDDICFNTNGTECKVNIDDEKIVFFLDYEEWRDRISEGLGDSDHIVEPLLSNPNYDGGGDYYEFNEEEFDYSGYHMNGEQRERLQKILNLFEESKRRREEKVKLEDSVTLRISIEKVKSEDEVIREDKDPCSIEPNWEIESPENKKEISRSTTWKRGKNEEG